MKRFGNPKRTKIQKRTAAVLMLTLRATLDGLTPETLARSYGIAEPEAVKMIEAERLRRERAA